MGREGKAKNLKRMRKRDRAAHGSKEGSPRDLECPCPLSGCLGPSVCGRVPEALFPRTCLPPHRCVFRMGPGPPPLPVPGQAGTPHNSHTGGSQHTHGALSRACGTGLTEDMEKENLGSWFFPRCRNEVVVDRHAYTVVCPQILWSDKN